MNKGYVIFIDNGRQKWPGLRVLFLVLLLRTKKVNLSGSSVEKEREGTQAEKKEIESDIKMFLSRSIIGVVITDQPLDRIGHGGCS